MAEPESVYLKQEKILDDTQSDYEHGHSSAQIQSEFITTATEPGNMIGFNDNNEHFYNDRNKDENDQDEHIYDMDANDILTNCKIIFAGLKKVNNCFLLFLHVQND